MSEARAVAAVLGANISSLRRELADARAALCILDDCLQYEKLTGNESAQDVLPFHGDDDHELLTKQLRLARAAAMETKP